MKGYLNAPRHAQVGTIFIVGAIAVGLVGSAAPAAAQSVAKRGVVVHSASPRTFAPKAVIVHTRDLDLRTDSGANTLYARVADAADQVCDKADLSDMRPRVARQQCAHKVVSFNGYTVRAHIRGARAGGRQMLAAGRTPMAQQLARR